MSKIFYKWDDPTSPGTWYLLKSSTNPRMLRILRYTKRSTSFAYLDKDQAFKLILGIMEAFGAKDE